MPDEPETILDAIDENARGPAEAEVDGERVKQHSLREQIAADKYARQVRAAAGSPLGGITFVRVRKPGTR